jgi:hypothetical protein
MALSTVRFCQPQREFPSLASQNLALHPHSIIYDSDEVSGASPKLRQTKIQLTGGMA